MTSQTFRLYKKTVTHSDVTAAGAQALAAVARIATGDVIVAAGVYVTESFNDSALTGRDAFLIDGDENLSNTILGPYIDLTNQATPLNGQPGVGNAGTVAGVDMNPGLPFVAGPNGATVKLLVLAWAGDATAGAIDIYLTVGTPQPAP